jgi:hypothetical protein
VAVPMISFCTAQLSLAKLLGGFNPKNMKVSWDDYSQYMGK